MLGVLSLILWALIVVVTLKYVVILLRADNNGEGGTLALMALAQRAVGGNAAVIVLLGIISGALFYGDAVITPALSVLSAVEGIKVVTERSIPMSCRSRWSSWSCCLPCSRAAPRASPRCSARSCASGSR